MRVIAPLLLLLSPAALAQNGDRDGEDQPPLPDDLVVPAAPALSAAEELATFVVADGYRVELVAAEPLINDPQVRRGQLRLAENLDFEVVHSLEQAHAKIKAPVRFIWGVSDPYFPLEKARAMPGQFAGPADLVTIDRDAHPHHLAAAHAAVALGRGDLEAELAGDAADSCVDVGVRSEQVHRPVLDDGARVLPRCGVEAVGPCAVEGHEDLGGPRRPFGSRL